MFIGRPPEILEVLPEKIINGKLFQDDEKNSFIRGTADVQLQPYILSKQKVYGNILL